jgi:hypothetical protein
MAFGMTPAFVLCLAPSVIVLYLASSASSLHRDLREQVQHPLPVGAGFGGPNGAFYI